MTALHSVQTVEAYPLGKPFDGRERFSMTPGMASVYNMLVRKHDHNSAFMVIFHHDSTMHNQVRELVRRGWLHYGEGGSYRFVHPVMKFKEPK